MKRTVFEEKTDSMIISRVIRDFDYTMASRHFHEEYEIYYLLEGERHYFIDHSTYYVKSGTLVFINKNQVHRTSPSEESSYHDRILIKLNSKMLDPLFHGYNFSLEQFFDKYSGVIRLKLDQQKYIEKLIFDIVKEIQNKQENCYLMASVRLLELLIYADRFFRMNDFIPMLAVSQSERYRKVQQIADYLSENYQNSYTLEEIANKFFISRSYLSRIFKEVTGFTVNEYINARRITRAKQLLAETTYNVTTISELLGYETVSYFNRVFREYVQTTPLKFRKQMKEGRKRLQEGKILEEP